MITLQVNTLESKKCLCIRPVFFTSFIDVINNLLLVQYFLKITQLKSLYISTMIKVYYYHLMIKKIISSGTYRLGRWYRIWLLLQNVYQLLGLTKVLQLFFVTVNSQFTKLSLILIFTTVAIYQQEFLYTISSKLIVLHFIILLIT